MKNWGPTRAAAVRPTRRASRRGRRSGPRPWPSGRRSCGRSAPATRRPTTSSSASPTSAAAATAPRCVAAWRCSAATTPSCVYARTLPGAQADLRHGRLSIGGKHLGRHITAALIDAELDAIIDDGRTGGLDVAVLDREGRRYGFKLVYAEDTGFYRLAGAAEYERFMADNGVVRDVAELGKELFMEVWAFRSPALRKGGEAAVDDHPDGALGMVILVFDLDADGLGDELFDDDSLSIKHLLRHYPKVPEGYQLEQFT
ncbi:hypothetical protein ACP4OV_013503 [Aristida adscensionis]